MAALPLFQLVQMFDELDYAVAITLSAHVMETLAVVNYNCLCVICNSKALCWLYAGQNPANTFCTGIVTQLWLSLFHLHYSISEPQNTRLAATSCYAVLHTLCVLFRILLRVRVASLRLLLLLLLHLLHLLHLLPTRGTLRAAPLSSRCPAATLFFPNRQEREASAARAR